MTLPLDVAHVSRLDPGTVKAMATFALQSLEAPAHGGVMVKPLQWGKTSYGRPEVETVIGVYRVFEHVSGGWAATFKTSNLVDAHGRKNFATEEEALSACEVNYERRILSALAPQPPAAYPSAIEPAGVTEAQWQEALDLLHRAYDGGDPTEKTSPLFVRAKAFLAALSSLPVPREGEVVCETCGGSGRIDQFAEGGWPGQAMQHVDCPSCRAAHPVSEPDAATGSGHEPRQEAVHWECIAGYDGHFWRTVDPASGCEVTAYTGDQKARYQRAHPSPQPSVPAMVVDEATHRHKKRGTEYVLIGIGKMQAENWQRPLNPGSSQYGNVDMREVSIYRSVDDGSLWARPREEFEDGRFEVLATALGKE